MKREREILRKIAFIDRAATLDILLPAPIRTNEHSLLDSAIGKSIHEIDEKPLGAAVLAEMDMHDLHERSPNLSLLCVVQIGTLLESIALVDLCLSKKRVDCAGHCFDKAGRPATPQAVAKIQAKKIEGWT